MKKLLALLAVSAALAACSKTEEAPAAAAPAPAPAATAAPAPAPAPAAMAPAAAASDLPPECNDYAAKVQACATVQVGAAADAIKSSLEQTKATWASMSADKAALAQACKAALDAFAQQAAAMKCG